MPAPPGARRLTVRIYNISAVNFEQKLAWFDQKQRQRQPEKKTPRIY